MGRIGMLVGDIVRRNGRRFGSKPAVIHGDRIITWAALDERANRVATYLLSRGLRTGDRVAVLAPNTIEWPELIYGVAKAGLVLVPVNARLTPNEAAYLLDDAGARAVIVDRELAGLFGDTIQSAQSVEHVLEIAGTARGRDLSMRRDSAVGVDYETALRDAQAVDPTPSELRWDDLQVLLYTSGTTGHPKGVMNTHRSMIMQAFDTSTVTESTERDVALALTPFYTTGGQIRTVAWTFLGQTTVIHSRFDPEHVVRDIAAQRITFTTFVPTMLQRVLAVLEEQQGADLSSLRRVSYGSAPSGPDLARRASALLGCDLQQRYGATEAGGQVTILQPWDHERMLCDAPWLAASCGRESIHAEITIVDDEGNVLPDGEIGEVRVVCASNGLGYWNQPEATATTFRADGVYTGDLGRRDAEGYFYIEGRKTDMIISGGFNVYPAELERVLGGHADVEHVAVIGAPDRHWGETPVAVIVPRTGRPHDEIEASLRALCRERLAGYKQPRRFEFRAEMPLGPAGKILKRDLKSEYTTM